MIHYAVSRGYLNSAKLLFDFATERSIPVKLSWGDTDILDNAIKSEARDKVSFVLERLGERCSTARETAKVQRRHLQALLTSYPRLMDEYLKNTTLSIEYGRFMVPQSLFVGNPRQKIPIAMTDDRSIEWRACCDEEAREFWKRKHPEVAKHLNNPTGNQIEAVAKVICIESCLRRDGNSVLKQLISAYLSPTVFTSDTVQTLVQWQWYKFFKIPFLVATVIHLMTTILFSIYVLTFDYEEPFQERIASYALHLCFAFSLPPATQHVLRPCRWGSMLLTLGLVANHWIVGDVGHIAAVIISFQAIFLWIQVLFYLLPFQMVGPLVPLVGNVLRSIGPFVVLFATVMMGFTLAFRVLFSNTMIGDIDQEALEGFSSTPRILMTLFFSTIGNVEPEAFRTEFSFLSFWRNLLHSGFLFFSTIVLFNLLVSILGDTHERMMYEENERRIKCRAKIVATWDSWYNSIGRRLENEGKYFHYLVPSEEAPADQQTEWQGRMKEILKILEKYHKQTMTRVEEKFKELETRLRDLQSARDNTREE